MSMPKFPTDVNITREQAISQILSSIAMEELGLSHILNAEGEKLQYILGTLEGSTPPEPATIDQVLEANDSVRKLLEAATNQQMFLRGKMSDALDAAANMSPMPEITIDPVTGDWLVNGQDTGVSAIGDISISSDGYWVVNGVQTSVLAQGPQGPIGATGATGPAGESAYDEAVAAGFVGTETEWLASLVGPTGPAGADGATGATGPAGADGATGATGATGPAGESAYDEAVAAGFVGTETEWLASLVGPTGPAGADGATGATGPAGADGATGATGATGPAGAGAIIPYASGIPAELAILLGGAAGIPSFVAFGTSAPGVSIAGTTINISGGTITNTAFSVPRNGTLTGLSATFTLIAGGALSLGNIDVVVQLFSAPANSETFTLVPGTTLNLTPSIPIVSLGGISTGIISGLSVPVTAGEQLLFVVSASNDDALTIAGTITGYVSGGVAIS